MKIELFELCEVILLDQKVPYLHFFSLYLSPSASFTGVSDGSGISISRSPYAFNIPHALTLAEELNILCVADRENGRIQCLNKEDGKLVHSIQPKELGSTVYSVAYSPSEGERA